MLFEEDAFEVKASDCVCGGGDVQGDDPDYIEYVITRAIKQGFVGTNEAVIAVASQFRYQCSHERTRLVKEVYSVALQKMAEHRETQRTWSITDCDRVDQAFAELNAAGIIARQDYTCCARCAEDAIRQEVQAWMNEGVPVRGTAFYSQLESWRAVDKGVLDIYFDSAAGGAGSTALIGREIADTLVRHGLVVMWDGRGKSAICVEIDWKRRR